MYAFILTLLIIPALAIATERKAYDNLPLSLNISDQERTMEFPERIFFNVPKSSYSTDGMGQGGVAMRAAAYEYININYLGNQLWIKSQEFEGTERLIVKGESGKYYIFNVNYTTAPVDPHVVIYKAEKNTQSTSGKGQGNTVKDSYSLIDLTRFAAQQAYAPQRLIKPLNVNQVHVKQNPTSMYQCTQKSQDCKSLRFTPQASWSDGSRYVSIIKVENMGNHSIELDPRLIKGRFITASFQHHYLDRAQSGAHTTALYVTHIQTFTESLR